MQKYINVQKDANEKIVKAHVNFKKTPKDRMSEPYIQTKLSILEQLWIRVTNVHQDIINSSDNWEELQASPYVRENLYENTEEAYISYKCDLMKHQSQFNPTPKSQSSSSNGKGNTCTSLKLPKITIPTFSGKYEEWITFRDLFISLVHSNSSLDDVQKLHYLKGQLSGEAEQLIRQLPITADNYKECWSQLESRYNNKNYLANCILKKLLNQRSVSFESAAALKDLADTTADCLHGLKNIGIDVDSWDVIVIHIVGNKLDSETRKQWELRVSAENSEELPAFAQFRDFLQSRFRALECIEPISKPRVSNPTYSLPHRHKVLHVTNVGCEYCNEDHRLFACKDFMKDSVIQRRQFVLNKKLCYNCLGSNHPARFCPSKLACRVCKSKHHSLLHPNNGSIGVGGTKNKQFSNNAVSTSGVGMGDSPAEGSAGSSKAVGAAAVVSCFGQLPEKRQVFLATAVVWAESTKGGDQYIRALLDQGSQASFVSEATVQHLGAKKYPVKGIISGLEGNKTTSTKYMVELKIHSRINYEVVITVQAYVIKSVTAFLPNRKMENLTWLDQNMALADPQYHLPNRIDILLGAEIYGQIIQEGVKKGPQGYPLAQATTLGWILSGTCQPTQQSSERVVAMHCYVEDNELLKRFWEIEADPKPHNKILTEEESKCEQYFAETTRRDSDGRYVIKLPFKTPLPACVDSNSRAIAEKRLKGLYSRFQKDEELKLKYKEVINEYLRLGFMEKVPEKEKEDNKTVYIPHHPVVRNDKDTTKVRVVYDASCKYENGVSLNDTLMTGPTLQPELRHLLMRWRQHPICMSADIIKMYCQIKVDTEDTNYQRLLWKESSEAGGEDYRLLRVTFGTASAPYLAVKSLQQVAHDEGKMYPMASERVINDFYMDDLLTGCDSVKEGEIIYGEMNDLLKKGGFSLQKWMTNSKELLHTIKGIEDRKEDVQQELKIKMDEVVKLLGLTWNRITDEFHYSVTLPLETGPATKRKIISHIARLYDPLGWVAPCVITAKVLIQKLWITGLEWDDEVTGKLLMEWNTYRENLESLMQINLPRWYGTSREDTLIELHGFADASKVAYAASVYLRRVDSKGNVYVSLVAAKTKVAPIKQVSIPRLELCGAVLVTRLLVEVAETLKVPRSHIRAWTDSTVVLAWINSHPSRWQTFVGNRVSEILTTLDSNQWAHIPSGQNPSDCASRGITPLELQNHSLWYKGPDILQLRIVPFNKPQNLETQLEEIKVNLAVAEVPPWSKYSSLMKLVRVIAYCRRFLNLRNSVSKEAYPVYLTSKELAKSLEVCIKQCQMEHFREEMELLTRTNGTKQLKSPLKSLNPFIDGNGVLRVGGRLEKAPLDNDTKHPILLPKKAIFTDLVITEAHAKTMHGGIQLMMASLSTKYYILGLKVLVKACLHKCVKCIRHNAQVSPQLMGQLPAARVTPTRAFKCSGVDYAGPINIRTSKGRGHQAYKGYICLFVCMVTRAVHIELVSDLSTQGFLAAFRRFVARRGQCTSIWSDNGTNFLGGSRELKKFIAAENSTLLEDVVKALANNGTTWNFIPPHAPNFGGLWEAGIKSTKTHLKKVLGDTTLTFEELSTVLAQIEACLNSRPLSRLESEFDTIDVLTPGHFLVGESLITAPDHNFEMVNVSNLRRWQLSQRIVQGFWRRWSQEYLTRFLHRYKWSRQAPEPGLGDVVLVKEDGLPPSRWLLGRVIAKHSGTDGVTRVVTLRTKGSTLKRPTSKLCVLPVTV